MRASKGVRTRDKKVIYLAFDTSNETDKLYASQLLKIATQWAHVLPMESNKKKKFLDAQAGVRSAMWLQPGKAREAWLSAFQMKDPPDLPVHLLVDPGGKLRCVVGIATRKRFSERRPFRTTCPA